MDNFYQFDIGPGPGQNASYSPAINGQQLGNVTQFLDGYDPKFKSYLRSLYPKIEETWNTMDSASKKSLIDDFTKHQTVMKSSDSSSSLLGNDFMKNLGDLYKSQNEFQLKSDEKKFEQAMNLATKGAMIKQLTNIPGQIADAIRMPGAIALQSAQDQARRTQDFIRSISLMDNVEASTNAALPVRKYYG